MKKSKLIELLNSIQGDPDVVLWNGYVEDWQDIDKDLADTDQVKMTREYFIKSIELEAQIDRKDWNYTLPANEVEELKKSYRRNVEWQVGAYVSEEDIKEKRYKSRRVVYIKPKIRGEHSFDRMGGMEY